MTEIGRRTAILAGTLALTISVLVGLYYGGHLVWVCIRGLIAGLIFGVGGMLIGNLIESYVIKAAEREIGRRVLERELAQQLAAEESEGAIEEVSGSKTSLQI